VKQAEFLDATLVLIGHGSSKNDRSGEAVHLQAEELRRRKLFAEVRPAFWKQEPKLLEVAAELRKSGSGRQDAGAPRVFFVPMFISEGYFSEGVIPKALGFGEAQVLSLKAKVVTPASSSWPGSDSLCTEASPAAPKNETDEPQFSKAVSQEWFYCKPVGTHESMRDVLLGRARRVITEFPFPRAPKENEITLIIAGHGTVQDENSRKSVERQAELLRSVKCYAAVHAVFLEEAPKISSCYELAETRNVVVVPFFIGEGMHVQEDIPILLGEPERIVKKRLSEGKAPWRNPTERKGKLVWYAESVGSDPALAEVILERVREAGREVRGEKGEGRGARDRGT
jgi:sirohydrochlorin cobaltochelatase